MGHDIPFAHSDTSRSGLKARLVRAIAWIEVASRTAHERRRLMALDETALKDIGVSKADAYREASRPFWDLSERRHR